MITKKEFEEGNFTALRGRGYEVLEFLRRNKDKAYISKEIADAVKSVPVAVTPILKKLVDDNLVDKKAPYYTLSKNDKRNIQENSEKVKSISKENKKEIEEEFDDEIEPYEGEDAEPEPLVTQ